MSAFKVYVGRLTPHVTEKDLTELFLNYGVIQTITLKYGFAFLVCILHTSTTKISLTSI